MKNKITKFSQAKLAFLALIAGIIILSGGITLLKAWYGANLKAVSSSTMPINFTVASGSSVKTIGDQLQEAKLIRSGKAFETYVRANPFKNNLQAGTYVLMPSMSVRAIVNKMASGDVARNYITILPDKRLDQIMKSFLDAGFKADDIAGAFDPNNYKGHPALASLPVGASLEGYLYPESFQKQDDTPASSIIRKSLDEMYKQLTPELVQSFSSQKLSVYQAIILASIVNQETDDPSYQPMVAQVFYSRLRQNISLGSDVTAYYASALAGKPKSVDIESPYNTRLHPGLPPGPIGNVTANALAAVARPAGSNFLFFIAGDDKKMYFSRTAAEHEQAIAKYCKIGCGH